MKFLLALLSALLLSLPVYAEEPVPFVAEASNEGELALHQFQKPEGMRVELVAAEPHLANPVAFTVDWQGRFYVAEFFRWGHGTEDNRSQMQWLEDDLASRTVAERVAYMRKYYPDADERFGRAPDRVRRLVDRDGDGRVDSATVFAGPFHQIEDGVAAGLLAWGDDVWLTNIPALYRLRDANQDGVAEVVDRVHEGFGVKTAFIGHDLHGLTLAPDGRIYFSVGDRGYSVMTPTGLLQQADNGAVFRCERDGSRLEVVNTGLRNPQELAFDDEGHLFTGDNNSDGGDKARWVYLIEGSESGWRLGYQYLNDRGPWNRERLWEPAHDGQAAYIVPPLKNFADGPSGLLYDPGIGLPAGHQGRFLLCDFRGAAANSGVWSIAVKPQGAGFAFDTADKLLWNILPTDVEIGYDGALYALDWINGWGLMGKGRIYRFADDAMLSAARQANTAHIVREGFGQRTDDGLVELLGHVDRRVRIGAQGELATRGAVATLSKALQADRPPLVRRHALWALAEAVRWGRTPVTGLTELFKDADPVIRAQAVRAWGDVHPEQTAMAVLPLLDDADPKVRAQAAIALSKIDEPAAVPRLLASLQRDASDLFLRHAYSLGLTRPAYVAQLVAQAQAASPAARMGCVLALRRLQEPQAAAYLNDAEATIVTEAARAIYDLPLTEALPQLAACKMTSHSPEPLIRRVLHANYRLGTAAEVRQMVRCLPELNDGLRAEAWRLLATWNEAKSLDPLLGCYRPLAARDVPLADLLTNEVTAALQDANAEVREMAATAARRSRIAAAAPRLQGLAANQDEVVAVRKAAWEALVSLESATTVPLAETLLTDRTSELRSAARDWIARQNPARAVELLSVTLEEGESADQQAAIDTLKSMQRDDADRVLLTAIDRWLDGAGAPGIQLDLLEAAEQRGGPVFQARVDRWRLAATAANEPLASHRVALHGGNAARGKDVFFGRSAAACRRCHKVAGEGSDVGPELTRIGVDKTREYLLEAIVDPNKAIAKGFETTVLVMDDGKINSGIVRKETDAEVHLMTVDRGIVVVPKANVEERVPGRSGMPDDIVQKISKRDLRDLVEYMSQLKGDGTAHGQEEAQ